MKLGDVEIAGHSSQAPRQLVGSREWMCYWLSAGEWRGSEQEERMNCESGWLLCLIWLCAQYEQFGSAGSPFFLGGNEGLRKKATLQARRISLSKQRCHMGKGGKCSSQWDLKESQCFKFNTQPSSVLQRNSWINNDIVSKDLHLQHYRRNTVHFFRSKIQGTPYSEC